MLAGIARGERDIPAGPHAQWWAAHMRAAARRAVATIAISPHDQVEAVRLLGLDPETVHWIPNGVDIDRFKAHRPTAEDRRAHWSRWLVHDPHGWDESSATPGSVAYAEEEVLDAFFDATSGE